MPAEAGIQAEVNLNHFKTLDSRFRGNDAVFPIATHSLDKGGLEGFNLVLIPLQERGIAPPPGPATPGF
jgi:hypothetical protein